uniref:Elongation factor 1 beta n=1 Tax=Phaseolus vulgaris TaxID=3885 RepID=T2DLK2_PHAVU|nr:elongation factor 1 beta [Phaseolus vulgaris]
MAVTFSDLHTEEGIKSLDQFLSGKTYISGDLFTKDDIKVYAAVGEKPGDSFPNASKWYDVVSSHVASSFPGKAEGVRFRAVDAPKAAAPAKARATAEEDEEDMDLFGEGTGEDKKVAEGREDAKKSTKKKERGKSSIRRDVNPWEGETDMKKLEEAVRRIEIPGLLWGASKLDPVGYGIKKLQMKMTIVDDLVYVGNLVEERRTGEPGKEYMAKVGHCCIQQNLRFLIGLRGKPFASG